MLLEIYPHVSQELIKKDTNCGMFSEECTFQTSKLSPVIEYACLAKALDNKGIGSLNKKIVSWVSLGECMKHFQ